MENLPKITKFLFAPDAKTNELYILHREYPACLIWVKQTTPIRFVILDWFEEETIPNEEILEMDFVQEAKDFFFYHVRNNIDKN